MTFFFIHHYNMSLKITLNINQIFQKILKTPIINPKFKYHFIQLSSKFLPLPTLWESEKNVVAST